tara:strand:- start:1363 stop:1971 length:609 start_codon:yes stop_codon:yes gene_type:complete
MTQEFDFNIPTNFISRYKKAFSREECRDLIEEIEAFDSMKLLFPYSGESYLQDQKAINASLSDTLDLGTSTRVSKKLLPQISPCVEKYLKTYSLLGARKFMLYDCKIKKIQAGAGFHAWHYENGNTLNARRTFVVQVYLNDDFDGGETEFLYQGVREKPSTGDVLIFPCQYTHVHRGNPPLGGTKYLATSWGWIVNTETEEY